LKAVNCETGDTLASAEATAENRDKVLNALGEVGNQLREKLGESLASLQNASKGRLMEIESSPDLPPRTCAERSGLERGR
jgi:hypothetical protein